mmetsp:Transcript_39241/g.91700  ORF Transcript_39241/g.91700 Transcript_39241/m.91700 type:complete len:683 (-) Transcript_39241:22-2070(-)
MSGSSGNGMHAPLLEKANGWGDAPSKGPADVSAANLVDIPVDFAHDGFGTIEGTRVPLIPRVPPQNKLIRDEILLVKIQDAVVRKIRVVLSRDVIGFGAEHDPTMTIMSDHIPLEEIQAAYEVEGDRELVEIITLTEGYNSGRIYQIRTTHDSQGWTKDLVQLSVQARDRKTSKYLAFKTTLATVYDANPTQAFIILMIVVNFFLVVVEVQIQPALGSKLQKNFSTLDILFSFVFVIDLICNIIAHWFKKWVKNPWNIFDFVIVSAAIVASWDIENLEFLQSARAFRVFRLAGKMKHLRLIINAIAKSLVPMLNVFLIGTILLLTLSVLGTDFFGKRDGQFFGSMFRTTYTLFLALALGEWDVLPVVPEDEDAQIDWGALIFNVLVVVVLLWIAVNVVVTILLDNFVQATIAHDNKENKLDLLEAQAANIMTGGVDPLIEEVLKLFDCSEQLSRGFKMLFHNFDYDQQGYLNFTKVSQGLKKVQVERHIVITEEDWEVLTEKGRACNSDGTVTLDQWDRIMRKQVKAYVQRDLTDVAAMKEHMIENYHILVSLRLLMDTEPGPTMDALDDCCDEMHDQLSHFRDNGIDEAVRRIESASIAILRAHNTKIPTTMARGFAPPPSQPPTVPINIFPDLSHNTPNPPPCPPLDPSYTMTDNGGGIYGGRRDSANADLVFRGETGVQ